MVPDTEVLIVVVAAKSMSDAFKTNPFPPNPNSPESTISTVQREIHDAGGEATAIAVDTRDYGSVQNLVAKTVEASVSFSMDLGRKLTIRCRRTAG